MTVGFIRWLERRHDPGPRGISVTAGNDVTAPLLCKEFASFRGEIATTALQVEHQQMIIEPTYRARCRVHMR
ncbi:hypothetical protein [Bradyrhizobium cenepequi]